MSIRVVGAKFALEQKRVHLVVSATDFVAKATLLFQRESFEQEDSQSPY
jgi:hypothetical protein